MTFSDNGSGNNDDKVNVLVCVTLICFVGTVTQSNLD